MFNSWNEWFFRVEVDAAHDRDTANIEITGTIDEAANNESWGVRDFFLYVAKCAKFCNRCNGPSPSDC